ncbi:MAG: hydrogenase maturation nickel metallochaperone HypA [Oscillibacter sp.]|nr:hydrogenase maturation nickel metallochaperone HypA [Oscillibacter sp.]
MHELGIVFHVIKMAEKAAEENQADQVASVTLRLGEVSGAIPHELTSCWNWAVKKTERMREAELIIETIPAVTLCEDCGKTYPTVPQGKTCPHCGSGNTYLTQGNEIQLKEITVT